MTSDPLPSRVDLIHPEIRELTAYHVAPATGMIKLDAMESPYGIDGALKDSWLERVREINVNRYPDPNATVLKEQLHRVFEIPEEFSLVLGNGSDELLQLIQLAVGGAGSCVMSPVPSFAMYEIIARYCRGRFVGVALNEEFQLLPEEWLSVVERENPSCVFFSHPNNPTGNFFPQDLIEQTVARTNGLVVIDEAYFAYSEKSLLSDLSRFDNVVIVRTLSKSGLAGLRIGYLIGTPAWANEFEKLRLPYNIDVLSLACAEFALENWETISLGTERVRKERTSVDSFLRHMNGLTVFPSEANFITVRLTERKAVDIYEALKSEGILVKLLDGYHPVLDNCLRFTVGAPEENCAVQEALQKLLGQSN